MKILTTLLLMLLLVTACSITTYTDIWPENIPSRNYFTHYYAQDKAHQNVLSQDDYLTWVHRFYFGWKLYKRGWLQTTDELKKTLSTVPEQQLAAQKMYELGRLVAPEWAKNTRYRVINTRHISIWGVSLTESINQGEQLMMLDSISRDVDALLAGTLQPRDIDYDRYYQYEEEPF